MFGATCVYFLLLFDVFFSYCFTTKLKRDKFDGFINAFPISISVLLLYKRYLRLYFGDKAVDFHRRNYANISVNLDVY